MTWWTLAKTVLKIAWRVGLDVLKTIPVPVKVSSGRVNTLLQQAAPMIGVESVFLEIMSDKLVVNMHLNHRLGRFDLVTGMTIEQCIISTRTQSLVLRETDACLILATGVKGRLVASLYRGLQFFSPKASLLPKLLPLPQGVTFTNGVWEINLAQLGLQDAIMSFLLDNVKGRMAYALPLVPYATTKLLDRFSVVAARCEPGHVVLDIQWHDTI